MRSAPGVQKSQRLGPLPIFLFLCLLHRSPPAPIRPIRHATSCHGPGYRHPTHGLYLASPCPDPLHWGSNIALWALYRSLGKCWSSSLINQNTKRAYFTMLSLSGVHPSSLLKFDSAGDSDPHLTAPSSYLPASPLCIIYDTIYSWFHALSCDLWARAQLDFTVVEQAWHVTLTGRSPVASPSKWDKFRHFNNFCTQTQWVRSALIRALNFSVTTLHI